MREDASLSLWYDSVRAEAHGSPIQRREEGVQELFAILVWPFAIAVMAVTIVVTMSATGDAPRPEPQPVQTEYVGD